MDEKESFHTPVRLPDQSDQILRRLPEYARFVYRQTAVSIDFRPLRAG